MKYMKIELMVQIHEETYGFNKEPIYKINFYFLDINKYHINDWNDNKIKIVR
jgi:hypothetical protein